MLSRTVKIKTVFPQYHYVIFLVQERQLILLLRKHCTPVMLLDFFRGHLATTGHLSTKQYTMAIVLADEAKEESGG